MKGRKKRQCGCGNTLEQINTSNKNLELLKQLQMPKPSLQAPCQIVIGMQGSGRKKVKRRMRMSGGAKIPVLVDKYGNFLRAY